MLFGEHAVHRYGKQHPTTQRGSRQCNTLSRSRAVATVSSFVATIFSQVLREPTTTDGIP